MSIDIDSNYYRYQTLSGNSGFSDNLFSISDPGLGAFISTLVVGPYQLRLMSTLFLLAVSNILSTR